MLLQCPHQAGCADTKLECATLNVTCPPTSMASLSRPQRAPRGANAPCAAVLGSEQRLTQCLTRDGLTRGVRGPFPPDEQTLTGEYGKKLLHVSAAQTIV